MLLRIEKSLRKRSPTSDDGEGIARKRPLMPDQLIKKTLLLYIKIVGKKF